MPILELAKEAEVRGLRSITLPEHTHVPLEGKVLMPGLSSVEERYRRVFDPYIAAAFIAATTSLEIGTGVALPAEHDAIALAKAIATLDYLSQGRLLLGIGFGYYQAEFEDHGVDRASRFAVVEETVALMRALWTDDVASFEGRHCRVSPSWSWPKPVQPGGPPILLGGKATERNMQRIVRWADGWMPAGMGVCTPGFDSSVSELQARWTDAGRADAPLISCFFATGPRDQMTRELEQAAALGVQRMEAFVEERPRDLILPILDDLAAIVDE